MPVRTLSWGLAIKEGLSPPTTCCERWWISPVSFLLLPSAQFCPVPSLVSLPWPLILSFLYFPFLLTFSWSIDRWLLWKWRQMCVFVLPGPSDLLPSLYWGHSRLALHARNATREIADTARCRRRDHIFVLFHVAEWSSCVSLYQQLLSNAQMLWTHWLFLDFRFSNSEKIKLTPNPKSPTWSQCWQCRVPAPVSRPRTVPSHHLPSGMLPRSSPAHQPARPWWAETIAHLLGFLLDVTWILGI